ncbi:hypothetical protein [Streptomyces sp. ISL-11]|uniref:hypothetical protein n=1 Tax=Streptomyces sp. ISL-11 TaxID=2819174 RepID=UPI001BE97638|nr:hypothetical protein [Streptomyces sp. ISL-11]MBT2385237.1 hypothetical protein [Streptomyces sp. ISL-11]
MSFNAAQFEITIDQLKSGLDKLTKKLNELNHKATATANKWYVPHAVGKALMWAVKKVMQVGSWVLNKIGEFLKGAVAPVMMYRDATEWQGKDIRGKASGVAGNTAPEALAAPKHWKGEGADAYTGAVKGQPTAATQIETSSDKIAGALTASAVAGVAFYIALAVFLVQFIAAVIAAIAATGSVVFSWAGAGLMIGETAVGYAVIGAAVAALTAVLAIQAQNMAVVEGEANDNSTFPGGHWPTATA